MHEGLVYVGKIAAIKGNGMCIMCEREAQYANDYAKYLEQIKVYFSKVEEELKEAVDHPDHYQSKKLEVIEVIEAFDLNFMLGNAIKYILRSDKKGNKAQDLKKAIWYLQREIDNGREVDSKGDKEARSAAQGIGSAGGEENSRKEAKRSREEERQGREKGSFG